MVLRRAIGKKGTAQKQQVVVSCSYPISWKTKDQTSVKCEKEGNLLEEMGKKHQVIPL